MYVWRRSSGWDVVKNTVLVDGRAKVGFEDAGELGENGGPLVVLKGVNM